MAGQRAGVLIALLVALGVDLPVIVALMAVVLARKRWVGRQPGAFNGAIRVIEGEVPRVSRSPPRQPSAPVTVRSATRPERSTRASPYNTSRGSAGGRTGGTVSGRVRAAAGARAGRAAAEEGMTGAISGPVTAASRGGRQDRSAPWGGRRHQPGRPRVQAVL